MKRKRWAVLLYQVNYDRIKAYVDFDRKVEDYNEPLFGLTMKAVLCDTKADAYYEAIRLAFWLGRDNSDPILYPEVEAI